jgi:hypothetical protein
MPHTRILEAVRRYVRNTFIEYGAPRVCEIAESVLIRDDCYCGRRFRADGFQAVWFIEEDEVKVYDRRGDVIRVTSASASLWQDAAEPAESGEPAELRRAA